ncbi:MAG TPA: decarboxylase [Burkholderiales bacterium]|nr:decarboxylase [Burkholderiales bacterium]
MELAEELVQLHDAPREVAPFSQRYPGLTPAAGYAAAQRLHEHRVARGWKPVGRKIGFTNRTLWQRYGVHEPMWGMVYDRTLLHARDNVAIVPLDGLVQPRIEPEIAFKLNKAPGGNLADCIEWMAHAVEIVQCHHPQWKVTLADCTADNGLHGRLIVGTPMPLSENLAQVEARLFKADLLVDKGVGANVLGGPMLSLAHLVELLKKRPDAPLRAGEIITTGVLTDAHPVAPGETWRTELTGLHGLRITFS